MRQKETFGLPHAPALISPDKVPFFFRGVIGIHNKNGPMAGHVITSLSPAIGNEGQASGLLAREEVQISEVMSLDRETYDCFLTPRAQS